MSLSRHYSKPLHEIQLLSFLGIGAMYFNASQQICYLLPRIKITLRGD